MIDTAINQIELPLNPRILGEPVSTHIAASAPDFTLIAANQVPGTQAITLVQGQFSVAGGTPIVFPTVAGHVNFEAGAGELLAIYPDTAALETALGDGAALSLEPHLNTHYALLRWPYDLSASAAGAMALAPATNVNFSANAGRTGFYALVREFPDGPGALDILTSTVASFRVPRQVRTLDDIAPGSWIIAEVNGAFSLCVTAALGYDLSWLRQVPGGAWSGDIGLRILTGLEAQLDYHAGGSYRIVLSRALAGPERQQIRLQLRKSDDHGLDLGLRSGVTATPNQTILPPDSADLLKSILGIHGLQILNQLQTDTSDLTSGFNQVKSRLQNILFIWNQLPQQASALLWSKLPDAAAIQQIASFADQLSSFQSSDLENLLQGKLPNLGFWSTPAGMFLEAIAAPGVLGVLGNTPAVQGLRTQAGLVSTILNNLDLKTILQALQTEINQRLDIQQIEQAVNSADLSKLDAWMAKRLQTFFADRAPLTIVRLRGLQEQLHKILGLRDELYAKALESLRKQYNFSFTALHQNAASETALVDLAFDFAENPSGAERALALALDGRFDQLLLDTANTGVRLKHGVLTHGIRRQASINLALPFFNYAKSHITDALASLETVDQTGGRLILYNGASRDLEEVHNQWQSALSIALIAGDTLAPGVVIHNQPQATYTYSLPMALKQLTRVQLKQRLGAELQDYFPGMFGSPGQIDLWLDGLIGAGNNLIGNALLSLDVMLPPEYVLAWLKAPAAKDAPEYQALAEMIRRKFREFLLQQYFGDANRYADVADGSPAFVLLVFASKPDRLREVREILAATGRTDLVGYYADDQMSRMIQSAVRSPQLESLFRAEAQIIDAAKNAALNLARFRTSEFQDPDEARKALAAFGAKVTNAFHGQLETFATDNMLPLGTLLFAEAARAFDPTLAPASARAMFSLQVVKSDPFPPPGFPDNPTVQPSDVLLESRIVNDSAAANPHK